MGEKENLTIKRLQDEIQKLKAENKNLKENFLRQNSEYNSGLDSLQKTNSSINLQKLLSEENYENAYRDSLRQLKLANNDINIEHSIKKEIYVKKN